MATRSKPKNFGYSGPQAPFDRAKMGFEPPIKPKPGYPGQGPAPPGATAGPNVAGRPRTPPGAEKYYPQWSGQNIKNNQVY